MNYSEEFKKFAIKHQGVNSLYYDQIVSSMTPYIIEERQLNVAQMDVFSRLMMDRIIFLGTAINDSIANIIQAQLLFLESTDKEKDMILCNLLVLMLQQFVLELLHLWLQYCFAQVKKVKDLA